MGLEKQWYVACPPIATTTSTNAKPEHTAHAVLQRLRKHRVLGDTVIGVLQKGLEVVPFGLGAPVGAVLGCVYGRAAQAAANTRGAARLLRHVKMVHKYILRGKPQVDEQLCAGVPLAVMSHGLCIYALHFCQRTKHSPASCDIPDLLQLPMLSPLAMTTTSQEAAVDADPEEEAVYRRLVRLLALAAKYLHTYRCEACVHA